jgi:hypothetical protein
MEEESKENMVKIKIPVPPNDPSEVEAEWLWAEKVGDNAYALRNIPIFVYGLSSGDVVKVKDEDGFLVFDSVAQPGGHSTYRIYTKSSEGWRDLKDPKVEKVIQSLLGMHCKMENSNNRIIGIDVLPEADLHAVYKVMDDAEKAGILQFEEGHCGHPVPAQDGTA